MRLDSAAAAAVRPCGPPSRRHRAGRPADFPILVADPGILADLNDWAADTAPDIAPLIERHSGS